MASSFYISEIKNKRRINIWYDPDLNTNKIVLSASLLTGNDVPNVTHYNTIFDENLGTSGTSFQPLDSIAISINPIPICTPIVGPSRVLENTTHTYNLSSSYDPLNAFTYDWNITGDGIFSSGTNSLVNAGKSVTINFFQTGQIELSVNITNDTGCFKTCYRDVFIGAVPNKLLIVRNSYG